MNYLFKSSNAIQTVNVLTGLSCFYYCNPAPLKCTEQLLYGWETNQFTKQCFSGFFRWSPLSSAVFIQQAWTIYPMVGNAARTDQHTVTRPASKVAAAAHRPIILALGASEFQAQPKARGEVCRAQVTDGRHFIGAAQQDLHARVEANPAVGGARQTGPCRVSSTTAATATQGAPAATVRVGATSWVFFFLMICGNRENTARKIYEKRDRVWEDISKESGRFMGAQCLRDWSSIPCSLSL